ncbi:MAG: acetylxylan esterase [Lentisphaerae bacterium]|nr:acetylxylan esterase [Lentisphaerota bacterium]
MKASAGPAGELPDPFALNDGRRVSSPADWRARRQQLANAVLPVEYGGMPPPPSGTTGELLHRHTPKQLGPDAVRYQYRIVDDDHPAVHFRLDLYLPRQKNVVPFPVILTGDGCYRFADDAIPAVFERDFALAVFSRVEIVPDIYNSDRDQGLYRAYPGRTFGALAAWAWGFHRCVDVLTTLDCIDNEKIAVTGHSRGGKTALLAGATDERIALTAPNGSGAGGAPIWRWHAEAAECMAGMRTSIPYWFGPELWQYADREAEMPFDQHFLTALVAPRRLLFTEGLADVWANPSGTRQTYDATREVYRFLGVADRIGIHYRPGPHSHGPSDWSALLDFMDRQFRGIASERDFGRNPYPDMPRAFSWHAPPT